MNPSKLKSKLEKWMSKELKKLSDQKRELYWLKSNMEEYPYKVQNFSYNGFCGQLLPAMASYLAKFKEWTNDPGIGIFGCSDGEERLIPTFALRGLNKYPLPKQDMSKKVMFGAGSHS